MADPRDPGKAAGDADDVARDPSRTPSRSEQFGADPRDSTSTSFGSAGEERPRNRAGRGNLRGTLREMNREAGGVGGGLANMTGGDGGCLRRLLPIILIAVVVLVVLVILGSMG